MVDNEFEIGHFEPCTSLTGPATYTNGSFTDTYWNNCDGPYETSSEDPNLEPDDSPCYPFGDTHGGTTAPNLVTGCDVFFDAIGDLDYDGTSYYADWPTSTWAGRFPGAFAQAQPTSLGRTYPQIQFETDNAATQFVDNCDLNTGANCVLPPPGPGHFYPYWTLSRDQHLGCVWEFGNVRDGNTFGEDAQYGPITFKPTRRLHEPDRTKPALFLGPLIEADNLGPTPTEYSTYFRPRGLEGIEALHARFVQHAYRPHSHPTWTVAVLERGAARFSLEATQQRAAEGELFVLEPDAVHTGMAAVPEGWTYKVLYIEPRIVHEWAERDGSPPRAARWVVFRDVALRGALALAPGRSCRAGGQPRH